MQYRSFSRVPQSRPVAPKTKKRKTLAIATALIGMISVFALNLANANATYDDRSTTGNMSPLCESVDSSKRLIAFDYFHIFVNDKEIPVSQRDISKYLKSGDTIRVKARVKNTAANPCEGTYLGLSAFESTASRFIAADASKQKLNARRHVIMKAGETYNLSIQVPDCYYQIDVNTGGPYKPGDYALDKRGRLITSATGGTKACGTKPTTTTTSTTVPKTSTTTSTSTSTTTTTTTPQPSCNTNVYVCCNTCQTPKPVETHDTSATVTETCEKGNEGIIVTLKNEGNTKENFRVALATNGSTSQNKAVESVSVAAGKSMTKTYSFATLGLNYKNSAVVVVSTEAEGEIARQAVTNDCAPEVDVKVSAESTCDETNSTRNGIVLTLDNSEGTQSKSIDVTVDGKTAQGSPVTIAAGKSMKKFIATDAVDNVRVVVADTTSNKDLYDETIAVNCRKQVPVQEETAPKTTCRTVCDDNTTTETKAVRVVKETRKEEVLGQSVTAPTKPQLANTGFDVNTTAILGGFLSLVGATLLFAGRRLRHEYLSW